MSVAPGRPMMRGSKAWALVRPVLTIGARHGVDVMALRRCLGAAPGDQETSRVPIERVFELWATLARATRESALPLQAGELLRLEDLKLVGFSVLAAPTGDDALAQAVRYAPLFASAGRWQIENNGDTARVTWNRAGERWLGHRLANESGVAGFVSCMRQVYGAQFAPRRVFFRHAAPERTAAHRAFFRCPVEFGQEDDGFSFPSCILQHTPPGANAALASYLRTQAEAELCALESTSIVVLLRSAMERELRRDAPDLSAARMARALGVSERTLRRHLQLEDTSFRAVRVEVQRDMTKHLLEQGAWSVTEVAHRVGFSDTSGFAHAVRRWFGKSARELRGDASRDRGSHRSPTR